MMHGRKVEKPRKCTLPSDYLTAAQKKRLNGEVSTVNLDRPMKWAEFKALAPDVQTMYINGLVSKYGISVGALPEMFGVSRATVYNHSRKNWGLRSSMTQGAREAFREFCGQKPENGGATTTEEPAEKPEPPKYFPADVERMTLALRGTVYFCTEYLRALPLGDGEYAVKIEITKENGDES